MTGCFWTDSIHRITALAWNEHEGRSHNTLGLFFCLKAYSELTIACELPDYLSQFLVPSELCFF